MKKGNDRFDFIVSCAEKLSSSPLLSTVAHSESCLPMPSGKILAEIMDDIRSVIFPGYFGHSEMVNESLLNHNTVLIERIYRRLREQVERGLCFSCFETKKGECADCRVKAESAVSTFIEHLDVLQSLLALDAKAAYEGDPAACSIGEVIFCYPSIRTLSNQRVAHVLYKADVPIIPRMITEIAHSETGIDIHPGAQIGKSFFIDHGTGVVIGETTVIGDNVRLYQGVTLGAKSFPLDEKGNPIKGIARHPVIGDDVTIYAGATILGRINVGKSSIIGANVWVVEDVPENSKIIMKNL
jgi:serine O-acetyltransferase